MYYNLLHTYVVVLTHIIRVTEGIFYIYHLFIDNISYSFESGINNPHHKKVPSGDNILFADVPTFWFSWPVSEKVSIIWNATRKATGFKVYGTFSDRDALNMYRGVFKFNNRSSRKSYKNMFKANNKDTRTMSMTSLW